jgi:RimJ/RimL family protein N-acetyltransferase
MGVTGLDRLETERLVGERLREEHFAYQRRYGFGPWVFHARETGEALGGAALRHVEIEGRAEVEVGYRVAAAWWGRGIATEMASALVGVARDRLRLPEIVAFTLPENLASRRVMEKVGFTYDRDIEWAALRHVLYRQRLAVPERP